MFIKKLRKLYDKCAMLLRNELLKKYPITHMMIPSQQASRWSEVFKNTLDGKPPKSISDLLRRMDLGVTRPLTGLSTDVDLSAFSLPFALSSIAHAAVHSGQRLFVYSDANGWSDFSPVRFKASMLRPQKNGRIEIAVVDGSNALISRHSITTWNEQAGAAVASGERAPLKRIALKKGWRPPSAAATPYRLEPIDAVYTWVDSSDLGWRELIKPYKDISQIDNDRFSHNDELKHSIRSIELFAPWIRNIYVVSNCAPPEWFSPSDRVKWIRHEDIMPAEILPTFNSHVIETFLHLISDLSENFIYFNDDFFLSGFVEPGDFFTVYGQSVARLEPYGVIPHLEQLCADERAEEWQHAAVNGARTLQASTGVLPVQLHRHAPYALKRSVFQQMLAEFPHAAEITRQARFRTKDDFSFASFFYHHYARSLGFCVENNENSMIVRHTNYRTFDQQKRYLSLRFFCMNDGGGSAADTSFNNFKSSFLTEWFPFKSRAEK